MASGLKTGLPPIADRDARLFILGSLPGDASLAAGQYYAHPRNQFWRLLGHVIEEPLAELDYPSRLNRLRGHGIGLWDVVAAAERQGSLDQSLRRVEHNPLELLHHHYPRLGAVAFNGTAAASRGRRLLGEAAGIDLIDLPSSSPANTRPFAEKLAAWVKLGPYCKSRPG